MQLLIKNIAFRDAGELNKVHEVPLSEKQKAVIKLISSVDCDGGMDTLAMTVTDANDAVTGKTVGPDGGPPKINYPFEKLEFVATK